MISSHSSLNWRRRRVVKIPRGLMLVLQVYVEAEVEADV